MQKRVGTAAAFLGAWVSAATAAAADGAARQAVVLTPVENMYSAPDATKDVVSQALLGQLVTVIERRDGFALIETPDRYPGWIPQDVLLVYPDDHSPRYAARGPIAEVTALMANLYRDPDVTTARPRTRAPLGTQLEVAAGPAPPENRWITVRLPDGGPAFVQSGDVRLTDAAAPRPRGTEADLVATARRFTGVPYTWGGMSPAGVDCSGLVSRVYWLNGVSLRRDADQQFDDPGAAPVEREQLRPGDLLFFGKQKITHVGMYVGDGGFINSTTHGTPTVHEERLDDPYWAALYRGARRPR